MLFASHMMVRVNSVELHAHNAAVHREVVEEYLAKTYLEWSLTDKRSEEVMDGLNAADFSERETDKHFVAQGPQNVN